MQTKEGVPEVVGEFTHSFAGVNYVEVAWAKPLQTNGLLTGYLIDVIAGVSVDNLTTSSFIFDTLTFHTNQIILLVQLGSLLRYL